MRLADLVFGRRRHDDPVLGALVRRWGRWYGEIVVGALPAVPLVLAGGRSGPDEAALALTRDLLSRYEALRPAIAEALFEHYQPYAGEAPDADLPTLARPEQVWPHVTPVWVLTERLGGVLTAEVAYRAGWDEEHTLGARFQDWTLVELNGSVRL